MNATTIGVHWITPIFLLGVLTGVLLVKLILKWVDDGVREAFKKETKL